MTESTRTHPAIAAAAAAIGTHDPAPVPVATIIRDDIAGIVLDSNTARYTVIVERHGDTWTAPSVITGTRRPDNTARQQRTAERWPLSGLSRKQIGHPGTATTWYAVTGTAAHDAISITLTSSIEQREEPIDDNGLAFAVVQALPGERPTIHVTTTNGRTVPTAF